MRILIGLAGERAWYEGTPEYIYYTCKERLREYLYIQALSAEQMHEIMARELPSLKAYLHAQDLIQRVRQKVNAEPSQR